MLKIKFTGQLVSPTGILDAQKAPLHAMLHDLSGFFPRLEITSGFQKVSVKLTFFWEGQLEPGTAQPQPTLPGNLARLAPKASVEGVGNSTEVSCPSAQDSQAFGPESGFLWPAAGGGATGAGPAGTALLPQPSEYISLGPEIPALDPRTCPLLP